MTISIRLISQPRTMYQGFSGHYLKIYKSSNTIKIACQGREGIDLKKDVKSQRRLFILNL